MRPAETIPGVGDEGEGGSRRMMGGGVNSTMIYSKNFCKYHNVPSKTIIK
jgi:hypothetical protein